MWLTWRDPDLTGTPGAGTSEDSVECPDSSAIALINQCGGRKPRQCHGVQALASGGKPPWRPTFSNLEQANSKVRIRDSGREAVLRNPARSAGRPSDS